MGNPAHEGIPVVGDPMWAGSRASWRTTGDGHARVCNGASSLARPLLPEQAGLDRLSPEQEGDRHECQSFGQGQNPRGPDCEGLLVQRA